MLPSDESIAPPARRPEGRIGVAAKRGDVIITEASNDGCVDEAEWLGAAIDRLEKAGARGASSATHPPDYIQRRERVARPA